METTLAPGAQTGARSTTSPLLEVDSVTLAFGGVKALSGVGFGVQPGSITAVIGPNGAGKTSLFNTISGFYRPTGGTIRFKGQDITRIPAPQRAKMGLGRSFQNIALFRGMTVLDNIKLGRHAHLKTNVFDALFYLGRARREETEDMARFILDVRAEWGVTVLMVEHDMGMVIDLSDHVVVLNFGQVISQGVPAVVQADPEVNRS